MATRKETAAFILDQLGHPERFSVKPMFGEFALYADGKPVAFICDDQFFVKILPESAALEAAVNGHRLIPGSKDYYLVPEDIITGEKVGGYPAADRRSHFPLPKVAKKSRVKKGSRRAASADRQGAITSSFSSSKCSACSPALRAPCTCWMLSSMKRVRAGIRAVLLEHVQEGRSIRFAESDLATVVGPVEQMLEVGDPVLTSDDGLERGHVDGVGIAQQQYLVAFLQSFHQWIRSGGTEPSMAFQQASICGSVRSSAGRVARMRSRNSAGLRAPVSKPSNR
jgi:TfoX/Sxy family transcriptional regulator of competence genes